jgi:hypothetical protein
MYQKVSRSAPLYCDAGPHIGKTRVYVTAFLYMNDEELAQYQRHGLKISLGTPDADEPKPAQDDVTGRARSA